MKPIFYIIMISSILLGSASVFAETGKSPKVVATVNGTKITEVDLDNHIQLLQTILRKKIDNRNNALEDLIEREILFQEAVKKNIHKRPELNYIISFQQRELYAKTLLSEVDSIKNISDKELQAVYDTKIKTVNINEYKVRHILFKKDDAKGKENAKTVIAQLDAGKSFEELAKEKSQGPSAGQGGDIGWMNEAQLVNMPTLAQALSEMKKGSYSKEPVESSAGWHVLKLDEVRRATPAPFEQTKNQLRAHVQQQKLKEYVANLRKKSKVEIKLK